MKIKLPFLMLFILVIIFLTTISCSNINNPSNKINIDQSVQSSNTFYKSPTYSTSQTSSIQPIITSTPKLSGDDKFYSRQFDVTKYDYSTFDNFNSKNWTREQYFAINMKDLYEDTKEYSLNSISVYFIDGYKTFADPDRLSKNGIDINTQINKINYVDSYWTSVKVLSNTKEGIKDALINLYLDKNVKHASLNGFSYPL